MHRKLQYQSLPNIGFRRFQRVSSLPHAGQTFDTAFVSGDGSGEAGRGTAGFPSAASTTWGCHPEPSNCCRMTSSLIPRLRHSATYAATGPV